MITAHPVRTPADKPMVIWLLSGCFLIFLMVIVGGITRLTQSGLSIVEWNVVTGTLPPLNEQQWMEEFQKYQQTPEYQKLNYHFNLSDFKSIFWWEYIHRLLGRLIGLVFIIPFVYFWRKGRLSGKLVPRLVLIFALGAFQGFLGWYMVKSGLVDRPYVSHYRLAIHLIAAFAAFGFTFWVALDEIYGYRKEKSSFRPLKIAGFVFLAFLILQIIYGAFVAGLKAGYVYNTWPKMGELWIAEGVTAMKPFYVNFLEGLAGVQFAHRYIAYILSFLAVLIGVFSTNPQLSRNQKHGARWLVAASVIQATLGIFTLVYAVPLTLGVVHQAGAFFLLGVNLFLLHRIRAEKR